MTYNVFGGTLSLTQSINQSYTVPDRQQVVSSEDRAGLRRYAWSATNHSASSFLGSTLPVCCRANRSQCMRDPPKTDAQSH